MRNALKLKYSYARYLASEELKRLKNKKPQEVQTVRVSKLKKLCIDYKKLLDEHNILKMRMKENGK